MYSPLWSYVHWLISIPVIIGCIKLRRLPASFYPVLILLSLGLINEITTYAQISIGLTNFTSFNLFVLVEPLLLTWQFYNWREPGKRKIFYLGLFIGFLTGWMLEGLILGDFTKEFTSYFLICSSFIIVLLSINKINSLIVNEKRNLVKNAIFLICMAFIIYFTYAAIVEIFWLYGLGSIGGFSGKIYRILSYVNLLVNIIFAFAILWIPNKQKFLMQS